MIKVGIMQPYFLPYIGYFQLISFVDKFIVYDNVEYTKKGWINRNRYLINGRPEFFTIPLRRDSDFLPVSNRFLADTWPKEKVKILNKLSAAYRRAPYFNAGMEFVDKVFGCDSYNLFDFIFNSIRETVSVLNIPTPLYVSSGLDADETLTGKERVIDLCRSVGATDYINPIGGVGLYDKDDFCSKGLVLHFLKAKEYEYSQFSNEFVPFLSIMDVLFFNGFEKTERLIKNEFSIV